MLNKVEVQRIGEEAVNQMLLTRQHKILHRNIKRSFYEFDIISNLSQACYVHEVRSTESASRAIIEYFPIRKLLTLISGVERHFPNALIYCHLVRIVNNKVTVQSYYIDELM